MKFLFRAALAAAMSVAALAAAMSVAAVAMAAPPAQAADDTFKYTIFQSPPQELTPTDFCYHLALPGVPIVSARNDTTLVAVMGTGADCSDFHQVGVPLGTHQGQNYRLEERVVMVKFLF